MRLSKTNYLLWRECNKNAWVKANLPDEFNKFELSEFEKNIIDSGNEVDVLARQLFPGGVLVENRNDIVYTQQLLQEKTKIVYQPVFETGRFVTACDILVWNESAEGYDLYEVKSSTVREYSDKVKKDKLYTYDLAFQYWVIKVFNTLVKSENQVKLNKLYLVRLNKDYVREGELNVKQLFKIEDYTDKVIEIEDQVREEIAKAADYISLEKIPEGYCSCVYLGRSAHCTCFKFINKDYPEYSVNDILRIGMSKAKLANLVNSKIYSILDVPDDLELGQAQKNQINLAKGRNTIIDTFGLGEFLDKVKYPISFIDYETYPSALPKFDGYSPYNQIPFQFSLHVVEGEGEKPKHYEYIFTKSSKTDFEFLETLQSLLPKTGSVVSWNKSFENTINKELGTRNSSYLKFLNDVIERTIDLRDVFTEQFYVHKDFKGKTSIKKVLPVIAPEFSYGDLDIQDGGQASESWNKIVLGELDQEELEIKKQHLLKYCELDTYAMYLIWVHLKEIVKPNKSFSILSNLLKR